MNSLVGNQFGKNTEMLTSPADLAALQLEMDELLGQITETPNAEDRECEESIEIPSHKRRRKIHGRNSIPEELITNVTIDLAVED